MRRPIRYPCAVAHRAGPTRPGRTHPPYVERRTAESLSERDVTRYLKRYCSREFHRAWPSPGRSRSHLEVPNFAACAPRRGLPLRIVAAQFDIPIPRLSRIEPSLTRDPHLETRIHTWLSEPNITQIAA